MKREAVLIAAALSLAVACAREGSRGGPGGPLGEARALIEQGDYDGALARLGGGTDAEALYLLGRAWAGKAAGVPRPPGGGLSPEEQQALDFLERAVAARPDHAEAHLAIAELLAPHVQSPVEPGVSPGPAGPAAAPPVTADRVLEAYGAAIQADPADTASVEALIRFAIRMERNAEAEAGFREAVKRDRENPEILVRFGDFLTGPGGKPDEALGVYAQALMWRPDDTETRLKIAAVHIEAARGHVERREFVAAEARLREARKHVVDPASPHAVDLREVEAELADLSGRR
jgi:tetratricopeptide (TPR) repeat protein